MLAALLGGAAAGVLASGAVAFYPPLIKASGDLLTEPLGALLLSGALIAVVLALRRPTVLHALGAGALLGLAILVRADLVLIPVGLAAIAGLIVWLRARRDAEQPGRATGLGTGLKVGVAMLAAAVAVVAPWASYASGEAGRFTPVSSGGASNLFVGTYLPGDGSMFGLKREMGFRGNVAQVHVITKVAERYPELSRDDALRKAAMDNVDRYVLGDPGAFAGMALRKVDRLWLDYTRGTHRNPRDAIVALHLALVALGFLGLAGALLRRADAAFWIPAAALAYVTAVNIVLVSEPRHNLPFMPVLLAAGAAGLVLLAQRLPRLTAAMRSGGTLVRRS